MAKTLEIPSAEEIANLIHSPIEEWSHQCHVVSLKIVKSGLFETSRVARGRAKGVIGQHSWVVVGNDCYDEDAPILDATLWSYDDTQPVLWQGTLKDEVHLPHGAGNIWNYGAPVAGGGPVIKLAVPVSREAELFLDLCGPLDQKGWAELIHSPVEGWPAAEIIAAVDDTPELSTLIPVDILGMLTDRNPQGVYLP